jgi:hypothetical protein
MDEQRYKALQASVDAGKATVAEKFLYAREKAVREEPPNVLQQQSAARQENPLLRPQSIFNRLGASADRREG